MLVHLAIDFRAEMHWPGSFDSHRRDKARPHLRDLRASGVRRRRLHRPAEAVTVLVDATTRKPTPLTPDIIARFQPWLLQVGD